MLFSSLMSGDEPTVTFTSTNFLRQQSFWSSTTTSAIWEDLDILKAIHGLLSSKFLCQMPVLLCSLQSTMPCKKIDTVWSTGFMTRSIYRTITYFQLNSYSKITCSASRRSQVAIPRGPPLFFSSYMCTLGLHSFTTTLI